MYCSILCKSRALAKPSKCDPETGLFHKTCNACGAVFTTKTKNTRLCDDCRAKSIKTSYNKWKAKNPEWQSEWNDRHKDRIREYKKSWESKNPEKVFAQQKRHELRRAEKRADERRNRSILRQSELEGTAKEYSINDRIRHDEFITSIGIKRITVNKCMCMRCGREFFISKCETSAYRNLKLREKSQSSPCPYCGDRPIGASVSHAGSAYERELLELYPNFTMHGYRPDWMDGLEIDLYDPETKVGVEFHGLYAHSEMRNGNARNLHRDKADKAEQAGIHLIQIYESEWVQRRECVIDRLDSLFHNNMDRFFARKLKIKELNDPTSRHAVAAFINDNHIQGYSGCQWAVGLFNGDELLAVCTFKYGTAYAIGGQSRKQAKYWELNRYATKLHTSVVGGLSRCIQAFARSHKDVNRIVSFADRRWTCSKRSAYASSGFKLVECTVPNYMYTDLNAKHPLHSKQYMRKSSICERSISSSNPEHAVYSPSKTEHQMATELGFYRIWDAGKFRYEMELN